jgi:GT2 family glycosyltransferase
MHRSGTSGLAHAFHAAGFNAGARVVGGSGGNEQGHWEDQFAVDLHEQLLREFGARWDVPFSLPIDWQQSPPARDAVTRIRGYLRLDRAKHPQWILKDPRLCLFAPLWTEALATEQMPFAVVIAIRHPAEVARSLHKRDGLSEERAQALWLDYCASSVTACQGHLPLVVDYDRLLADPAGALERIKDHLPAGVGGALVSDQVAAVLQPERRHHQVVGQSELPMLVSRLWQQLRKASNEAATPLQDLALGLGTEAAWLQLLSQQSRDQLQGEHQLWLRVGRAEAAIAAWASQETCLPDAFSRIDLAINASHQSAMRVFSDDISRMQAALQESNAALLVAQTQNTMAAMLSPQVEELRRLQEAHHAAHFAIVSDQVASTQAALAALTEELASVKVEAREQREGAQRVVSSLESEARELRDRSERLVSSLEETRRENAILAFHNERLAEAARQFDQVISSRSWRWTRPLRALGRLLSGRWSAADSEKIRAALGEQGRDARSASASASAPLPTLQPAHVALPDVFVWAVIDWHFRFQRPQHLAAALAKKGHRVFYISNNTVDSAVPGFKAEALSADGRLFQVSLHLKGAPPIYFGMPSADENSQLRDSLASLLAWTCSLSTVSLVQHPFWTVVAQALPSHRLVYDCMDHHAGFDNTGSAVLEAEAALVRQAELTVVSSAWLADELSPRARSLAIVRNAGEYAFFSERPKIVLGDSKGRRIIGYYGAIAEWFDLALIRAVAVKFPQHLVRLVGADTVGASSALADLVNVEFIGEVPYKELPQWLHAFDVCLLPFKVLPLTLATNPVKVYEYLAAAKPVVAVDLPEMQQFGALVSVASSADSFVAAVAAALEENISDPRRAERQVFASNQTWEHRAEALDQALDALVETKVSVVVLTYNNLAFTEACLFSIEAYSDYTNLEVIVVDNASADGSREWLARWAAEPSKAGHRRRLILNDANLGFSAGNNVGLAAASGEVLVLLNNDTYVTPGWVRGLTAHLSMDEGLGLVGPVTNNIGNEAKISIAYDDMVEMIRESGRYTRAHCGQRLRLKTAAFFCVAMRREVFERVGFLDEAFGVGFFEDDDYCRRVEAEGLRIAAAEDVFVHHHLSASFDALKAETKRALFEKNKAIYEAKWGVWEPHGYR